MAKVKPSVRVALFFAMLTLIGLCVTGGYGLPCDEPAEQEILRENLKEYAFQILGANSQTVKAYDARGTARISESIEKDHGQSAYYLAAPLLQLSETAPDQLMLLWHLYTWLWFMVGVVSLYCLARALGLNRTLACATSLILYLSPRFFAEGHYNNKDVVLLALVLWTLAAGAAFLRQPNVLRATVFSLAGALAANTKIVGVFAWALMGLTVLVDLIRKRALTPKRLLTGLWAILFFAVCYVALTPAIWADPKGFVPYLLKNATGFSRWSGVVLFKGELYDPAQGTLLPHSYLPTMITITTPLPFLLLMAVGQIYTLVLCLRGDARRPLLLALTALWLIPAAYVVIRQPLMYNGWRHFYFLYAGLAAMAAMGLEAFRSMVADHGKLKKAGVIALTAAYLYLALGIAWNHPYQYAYYNALAGTVENRYELDYWDVSTVNAMRKLCASLPETEPSPVLLGSRDDMSDFGLQHGVKVLNQTEKDKLTLTMDGQAPYLYSNPTYALIYGVDPPQGYVKAFSIISYGHEIGILYAKPGV